MTVTLSHTSKGVRISDALKGRPVQAIMKTLALVLIITIMLGSVALLSVVSGRDITRGFRAKYSVTVHYPTISASAELYLHPDEINQWIREFEIFIQSSGEETGDLNLGGIRFEQKMLQGRFFLEVEVGKWLQWITVYDFSYIPQAMLS